MDVHVHYFRVHPELWADCSEQEELVSLSPDWWCVVSAAWGLVEVEPQMDGTRGPVTGDGAGVRVEQGGLQRADGVEEDGREAAGETQRAESSQLRVHVPGVCRGRHRTICQEQRRFVFVFLKYCFKVTQSPENMAPVKSCVS